MEASPAVLRTALNKRQPRPDTGADLGFRVAGPGFEPGKAEPAVLQASPIHALTCGHAPGSRPSPAILRAPSAHSWQRCTPAQSGQSARRRDWALSRRRRSGPPAAAPAPALPKAAIWMADGWHRRAYAGVTDLRRSAGGLSAHAVADGLSSAGRGRGFGDPRPPGSKSGRGQWASGGDPPHLGGRL